MERPREVVAWAVVGREQLRLHLVEDRHSGGVLMLSSARSSLELER